MIMNRGYLKTEVRGNLTAIIQKDKWNVNILPNMHSPSLKRNFWGKHGQDVKPAIVQDYIRWLGYVEEADWFGSRQRSYSFTFWTLPLSTAVIFSPLMVQNYHTDNSGWHWWGTYHKSREGCLDLRPQDKEDKPLPWANWEDLTQDTKDTGSCSVREFGAVCVPWKSKGTRTNWKCQECNRGLCPAPCSKVYRTKPNFWVPTDTKIEEHNTPL